jgi:hypothetical protein
MALIGLHMTCSVTDQSNRCANPGDRQLYGQMSDYSTPDTVTTAPRVRASNER